MISKETYTQAVAFLIKVVFIDESNLQEVINAAKVTQAYKEQEYQA